MGAVGSAVRAWERTRRLPFWVPLMLALAAIRLTEYLTGHVPMGHDTLQYLQLQHLIYSESAADGQLPLWLPFMTNGTVSSIWVVIGEGLLPTAASLLAPLAPHLDTLALFQAGLLVDEAILLGGAVLLARRCFRSNAAVALVAISVGCSGLAIVQVWWNFHLYYLLPLILWCADRALWTVSARFLFFTGMFAAASLLGALPYFAPVVAFAVFLLAITQAALHPHLVRTLGRSWRSQIGWRHLVAILVPAVLGASILLFQIVGVQSEIVYSNTGRATNGEVQNLEEFVTYGGYVGYDKYLQLITRGANNNLDNSLYGGLLLVPFAAAALVGARGRAAAGFGVSALALALFGGATIVTIAFFQFFPLGRYFRHIGLVAPLTVLFLSLYAGYGMEAFVAALPRPRRRGSRLMRGLTIATPLAVLVFILALIALERFGGVAIFDLGFWSNIQTRNQLIPDQAAANRAFEAALVVGTAEAVLLCFVVLVRQPWPTPLLGLLMTVHAGDVLAWRLDTEMRQAPPVSADVRALFTAINLPYAPYRGQTYPTNPRFAALAPAILEDAPTLRPDVPYSTIGAYGALYWNIESFVGVDALASIFRTDHWLRSIDDFYNTWAPGPRSDERHLGFPLVTARAGLELAGVAEPKLQVFRHLYLLDSELAVQTLFGDAAYSGDVLIGTGPAPEVSVPGIVQGRPSPTAQERVQAASVTVERFTANELQVRVLVPGPEAAVLYYADAWHPYWRAWVDGQSTPVYRAALGYKAVALPAGASTVDFRFGSPVQAALGRATQVTALLALGCAAWLGLGWTRRRTP